MIGVDERGREVGRSAKVGGAGDVAGDLVDSAFDTPACALP